LRTAVLFGFAAPLLGTFLPAFGPERAMWERLEQPRGSSVRLEEQVRTYRDGRATVRLRLDAMDQGPVLKHGADSTAFDGMGARDVWAYQHGNEYFLHYDAAGPRGWVAALATSRDLVHWSKCGPVLDFGQMGEPDSASASYGTTYFDGTTWHMFYLGTPASSPPPDRVPAFPYMTLKATGKSARGPWIKQNQIAPFQPKFGSYYALTASPGHIVPGKDGYRMFFSACAGRPNLRTLGIARTRDLNGAWQLDPNPILPPTEQVENSSLYYQEKDNTWFLFTNHVGVDARGEYTDAIWVYWTQDLDHWNPDHKAVVLDRANCRWSPDCIGLPSILKVGDRLAILYDAPGGNSTSHMRRDVGLAWLNLPLVVPAPTTLASL
jgi:predicted GH43/DUF377 family glycosyl hydrolase